MFFMIFMTSAAVFFYIFIDLQFFGIISENNFTIDDSVGIILFILVNTMTTERRNPTTSPIFSILTTSNTRACGNVLIFFDNLKNLLGASIVIPTQRAVFVLNLLDSV